MTESPPYSTSVNSSPNVFSMRDMLGIEPPEWHNSYTGPCGMVPIFDGALPLVHGACNYVLGYVAAWRDKGGRVERERDLGIRTEDQFRSPYGVGHPAQHYVMLLRPWMERRGLTSEQLGWVSVTEARNCKTYARALRPAPLTIEEYMCGRMTVEPMRIWDFDYPCDGAVAVVMTAAERARDLPQKAVYLQALDEGLSDYSALENMDFECSGARRLGERLWRDSGLGPGDISCAMLYDGFSIFVPPQLEALGLVGEGEAGEFLASGEGLLGGKLPLNPFGGSLCSGRLFGMNHLVEAYLQLSGRAEERQVVNASAAIATVHQPQRVCGVVLTRDEKVS